MSDDGSLSKGGEEETAGRSAETGSESLYGLGVGVGMSVG